jgi:hypothetical protein
MSSVSSIFLGETLFFFDEERLVGVLLVLFASVSGKLNDLFVVELLWIFQSFMAITRIGEPC